jgi:lycopene beta-cyclase
MTHPSPTASRAAGGAAACCSSSSSAPPPLRCRPVRPRPTLQVTATTAPPLPPPARVRRAVLAAAASATAPPPIAPAPAAALTTPVTAPLPAYDPSTGAVDLVVAGGGPSGLSVAARVARAGEEDRKEIFLFFVATKDEKFAASPATTDALTSLSLSTTPPSPFSGYRVTIVDPYPLAAWPNNYGVWVDEFEAMGLEGFLDTVWPRAAVWLGDGKNESGKENAAAGGGGRRELARPYGRVDRKALKARLLSDCVAAGVTFVGGAVTGVEHDATGSTLAVAPPRAGPPPPPPGVAPVDAPAWTPAPDPGLPSPPPPSIRAALVLDATGHARRLVSYDAPFDPGFQGAYGAIIETESPHPFPLDEMLFMDWRSAHTAPFPAMDAANAATPTFLYAMPFSPTLVFVEETSLVARPAVPFPELKARLEARLAWLGVTVKAVHEEEFCLIPMGGVLPVVPQRTLGLGGTAGQVHPSTGYMVSRALGAAPVLADAVVDALAAGLAGRVAAGAGAAAAAAAAAAATDGSPSSPSPPLPPGLDVDEAARRAWASIWPVERKRQRAFFCFGMDVLLRLNLAETRQFFAAFFALPDPLWHGFLSARLGFGQLIAFGLALFARSSNAARADLLVKGLPGLVRMLAELATGLREPEPKRPA